MKNSKTLKLKIVLTLALALVLSPLAYASEVSGTFGSSGNHNTETAPPPQQDNPTLSGSVSGSSSSSGSSSGGGQSSGGSSSSSSTQNQNGEVLGASTASNPAPSNTYFSRTGQSTSGSVSNNSLGENTELAQLPPLEENAAETLPSLSENTEEEGVNWASWFWIILLSLLLIGVLGYFYSRPVEDNGMQHI